MTLQSEEVLELVYDACDDLALARCPASAGFRPCPVGVSVGGRRHQRPVEIRRAFPPLYGREAFVGQVSIVAVLGYEGVADLALIAGGASQKEGRDDTLQADRERHLEVVVPLRLGDAATEGSLSREEALAAGPYARTTAEIKGASRM